MSASKMTSRERALAAYSFMPVDVPCFDLMEGAVWPELAADFDARYGLKGVDPIEAALGSDFKWAIFGSMDGAFPLSPGYERSGTFSDTVPRPLGGVKTPADVREMFRPDASRLSLPDFKSLREKYPDRALICCPGWMPVFSGICDDFGMEAAMVFLHEKPEIVREYVRIKGEHALAVIRRCIKEGAKDHCDFFWLGDDFAGEASLLVAPEMWREFFLEPLRLQVQEARDAGLFVMFHSCGDVAAVYEDFIRIGINSHCGVQTSCPDMSPERLAETIGGRLVIHGGVDAQDTLVAGDRDEVIFQTKRNIRAFNECGGYVVSNSHHGMADIGADKIVAMSEAAGRWRAGA